MRIVHIIFGGAFNEEMSYQGNLLPKENNAAGHDVTVIAGCYKWNQGVIDKVPEEDRILNSGIRLIRLKFDKIITEFISVKIKKTKKLKNCLTNIKPDVIFFHDVEGFELLTVARYKKNNPSVKLYVDSHSDKNNSATNWVSLNFLYRLFYKPVLKKSVKYINKLFYISYEVKDFLKEIYGIPDGLLEFYPLGGTIINEEYKSKYREEVREELGISQKSILICHSGKMDTKKRTYELLDNFLRVKHKDIKLIIIGAFAKGVEETVLPMIKNDDRIFYLGWKNSDELIKYIAASDLYLQPGSQSATMQNALCAGTPVLFENVKSHDAYMKGNAFAINNYDEMESIFYKICNDPSILKEMSRKAYLLARDILDYKKMAARITERV